MPCWYVALMTASLLTQPRCLARSRPGKLGRNQPKERQPRLYTHVASSSRSLD